MSDDDAIETAFHAVTEAQGGTHIADGGWWWLEGFGDLGKEYAAIRDDVAVWDVSPLNKWDFRGPAALEAAQRVFSNDALGLEVGQARYGAFLDADGLMVDDGTVFNTGGGHCWVMTNGKDHDDYFGEALAGFDVEFEWIAPRMPHLGVIGPRSREVVQKLTDADVGALRYFRFLTEPVKVAGVEVFLSRTGFGGELGFELFLTDPGGCRGALERDRRRGRDTVRRRGDRARADRGRVDRHRLRLRGAPADAVRLQPGSAGPSRRAWRVPREGEAPRGRGRRRRTAWSRSPTSPRRCPSTARRSPWTARRSASSRARPTARGSGRSGSP